MQAFHNKQEVKDKYLKRVQFHFEQDNIIRGTGWRNGKGCAVGCTLENYNHKAYETELGIPEWLAHLEDKLFEGMSEEKSKTWPMVFLENIPVGADLNSLEPKFKVVVLKHSLTSIDKCKYDEAKNPEVKKAIDEVKLAVNEMIYCHENGLDTIGAKIMARNAEGAAWSAWGAESASSVVWSAAESAEWSAEWSARSAARSAASAARSAASAARSAAWGVAWSAAYDFFADELIKLFKELSDEIS